MIRDVYPHDRFPEEPYERTANDVIIKEILTHQIKGNVIRWY